MGVISTNSHVCVHKLCSLCVRSQEFNSRGITTWAEGKQLGYIGYNRLQNTFPPQMKRAYTEHNCA